MSDLYPPSVTDAPPDLATPNQAYRQSVRAVLYRLFVFLGFYFGYMTLFALAMWYSLANLIRPDGSLSMIMLLSSIAFTFLFVLLAKGLFHRHKDPRSLSMEITPSMAPELFAFLTKLSEELGAPRPDKVFISPDTNAAIFYDTSILNLLLPTRKNLQIGLGLVNTVNLGEFKAVLAHEFGHFSQRGTRLGTFVAVSNRIIGAVVWNRDGFDRFLFRWYALPRPISWVADLVGAVSYGLRWGLCQASDSVNKAFAAFSRQGELHADLVAVSICGSDLVSGYLSAINLGTRAERCVLNDLGTAMDGGLYTRDMYAHQSQAEEALRTRSREPKRRNVANSVRDLDQLLFRTESAQPESLWSSHPSDYDRKRNANRTYVKSAPDERSSWVLFKNALMLREAMTQKVYKEVYDVRPPADKQDTEVVRNYLAAEHSEIFYNPLYDGYFDNRSIVLSDLDRLIESARRQAWSGAQIHAVFSSLYQPAKREERLEWLDAYRQRAAECDMLEDLASGVLEIEGEMFSYRDSVQRLSNVPVLLQQVRTELQDDLKQSGKLDAEIVQAHLQAVCLMSGPERDDLEYRYRFLKDLQDLLDETTVALRKLRQYYWALYGCRASSAEFQKIVRAYKEAHGALANAVTRYGRKPIPPMNGIAYGQELGACLLPEPMVAGLPISPNYINIPWIHATARQLIAVRRRARRLHSKNLGIILMRQESIATRWWAGADVNTIRQ